MIDNSKLLKFHNSKLNEVWAGHFEKINGNHGTNFIKKGFEWLQNSINNIQRYIYIDTLTKTQNVMINIKDIQKILYDFNDKYSYELIVNTLLMHLKNKVKFNNVIYYNINKEHYVLRESVYKFLYVLKSDFEFNQKTTGLILKKESDIEIDEPVLDEHVLNKPLKIRIEELAYKCEVTSRTLYKWNEKENTKAILRGLVDLNKFLKALYIHGRNDVVDYYNKQLQ